MTTPCSALSESLSEDLGATAPSERGYLIVEQPGPWGRDALAESALPTEISGALAARAKEAGVRVQVVRRGQGRYAMPLRLAWTCCVTPGRRFLERLTLDDPAELLDLDLSGVADGRPTGVGRLERDPLFLVCTHGTRDPCCAKRGLPLARAVYGAARARTWQTSHLGGHRFAATMACLPLGAWLGRVPAASAGHVVAACREHRLSLEHLRGRAGLPASAQAAEIALRRAEHLSGADDVATEHLHRDDQTDTHHISLSAHGRRWEATARCVPTGETRPLSCGAGAKVEDPGRWEVGLREV